MKYILKGHKAVPVDDVLEWAKWFESADRTVSRTELLSDGVKRKGDILISTIFLGLDSGFGDKLLLFETMVFGGEYNEYQVRYTTWAEAKSGHKQIVEMVKGAEK